MDRRFTAVLVVVLAGAIPARVFASGSVPSPQAQSRNSLSRFDVRANQSSTNSQSQQSQQKEQVIADEPYNLGKELFGGKYKFGNPQLSDANMAEKKLRLVSLRNALPAAERANLKPAELSKRLTNHEMNALEYYIGARFGKVITKAPSWAKQEPRPQQLASVSAQ